MLIRKFSVFLHATFHTQTVVNIMRNILILIFIIIFTSCNSNKKTTSASPKLNIEFIGVYEFKTLERAEHHLIIIDTLNGKYNGIYYGSEDGNGEDDILFYGNYIENLNINKNKISFEIGERNLYETTRFKIIKNKSRVGKDSIKGASKSQLKYSGLISVKSLKLNCESEYGDCWENEMYFEKLIK